MVHPRTLMDRGIPQRKALSFSALNVPFSSPDPALTGRERISDTISDIVTGGEALPGGQKQAVAIAFSKARRGKLGPAARAAAGRRPSA